MYLSWTAVRSSSCLSLHYASRSERRVTGVLHLLYLPLLVITSFPLRMRSEHSQSSALWPPLGLPCFESPSRHYRLCPSGPVVLTWIIPPLRPPRFPSQRCYRLHFPSLCLFPSPSPLSPSVVTFFSKRPCPNNRNFFPYPGYPNRVFVCVGWFFFLFWRRPLFRSKRGAGFCGLVLDVFLRFL